MSPSLWSLHRHASPARPRVERLQERLEGSAPGRALISFFVLVTLGALAVTNLPDSAVKAGVLAPAGPYLAATGLDQNWGVFAPDSRRTVLILIARVRYDDGSTAEWRLPEGGPVVGAYWDYRWRKWAENLMTIGGDAARLQRPAAVWIARDMRRSRKRPVLVTLAARSSALPPPGRQAGEQGPWREDIFYRLSFR